MRTARLLILLLAMASIKDRSSSLESFLCSFVREFVEYAHAQGGMLATLRRINSG